MDKRKALQEENKRHEKSVKKIKLAGEIARKVKPLLPNGWSSTYFNLFDELCFSNDELGSKDNRKPSEEFKLICKILKKAGGYETLREAKANKETNELTSLEAHFLFDKDGTPGSLTVEVTQYHPDHKCEIKWETKTYQKAIVSDACLGLGGE